MLRALVAGEPRNNPQAEAEVWSRLQQRRRRTGRLSPTRRGAIAVSLATLAVSTATAVVVITGSFAVPTAEAACSHVASSPTACLSALARLAAATSAPGGVVYQRAVGLSPVIRVLPPSDPALGLHLTGVTRPFGVRQTTITETWVDRTTWHGVRRVSTKPSFPTARDRAAWRAAGSPSQDRLFGRAAVGTSRNVDGERFYVMDFAALQKATGALHPDTALPTDPTSVIQLMRRLNLDLGVGALMLPGEDPLLTPAQRAAIFKALPRVPGVRVLGTRRDALGRPGVAIAIPWRGHGVWVTLYDPRTSRMLADGAVIDPNRVGPLKWLWTYTVDAASAPALLTPPNHG